uniref:Uncharacterized protein n=1 Tax=Arundo donax TaxID=35708 RepID=A0A0A9ETS4_ARUDO
MGRIKRNGAEPIPPRTCVPACLLNRRMGVGTAGGGGQVKGGRGQGGAGEAGWG